MFLSLKLVVFVTHIKKNCDQGGDVSENGCNRETLTNTHH